MFGKIIKVAISIIAFVLILSLVFPAGCGISFHNEKCLMTPPGFTKPRGSMESLYHPILTFDEPKMYYMISDEEGNGILVDLPQNMNKEEIEDRIEQKIIEESHADGTIRQNGDGKDDMSEAVPPNETTSLEDSEKYIVLTNWMSEDYLDGHLFCNVNEMLNFDISSLISSYNLKKCEWDFDGDGNYDVFSFSPTYSYKYSTIGLYDVHIRITYSYNYSYYPIYFEFDNLNVLSLHITTYYGKYFENDNITSNPVISPSFIEYQNIVEYIIKVSVGSEDIGYPPILDFEFSSPVEERELIRRPTVKQDETEFRGIFYIQPMVSQDFTDIYRNEVVGSSNVSNIYIKVKNIENEKISYFESCTVEFNASKTIDQNEGTIFSWDFGDGEFGEGTEVSHTYTHRGTYTATLYANGWNHSISKTFVVRRGFEDPKQVIVTNYYTKPIDNYLICHMNEPMIFDIFELVRYVDLYWVEWDFDSDGIYEVNVTSSWITKTFYEPGYFEVSFRYTYSCRGSRYVLWNIGSFSTDEENHEKSVISYNSNTNWIKIVVKGEDNAYPLIPDFTTKAPNGFSWWNQEEFLENYYNINEQKYVTYLKYYSSWNNRLNSWKNPVTFNANSTLIPKGTTHDDFFYFWDFGDGETATGIEVSHEFENPQNDYQVKLTVWNDNYNVSVIKMVAPRPSSPNIYLYRETSSYDTIRVIVDGRVTKAVPMVELGTEIVWKDVFIENGKLYFDGKCYDFLYYEELLNEPRTSKYGWILERDEEGRLFLDRELLSLEELKDFFRAELIKAGLFENEIEDFIDEWLGEGARLFPAQKAFRYSIMYVPEDVIEEIIQVETEKRYDEIIRVHFLIQPVDGDIHLVPPQYPKHQKGGNILHEWGVYIGDSISEKEKDNNQSSWFDNFIEGYCDFQMCILNEDIMKSIKSTYRPYQLDLTRIQMLPINLP